MKDVKSLFVGTGGVVSCEVAPTDTKTQCDFFENSYGLIGEEVSEKEETIEANKTLITYLNEKISELQRLVDTKTKENNQLEAEIQILKARADNETVLSSHEKHALAQWCFCDNYQIYWFCNLYFQCLPYDEIPNSFADKFKQLAKKLKELIEVDPYSGRQTLCRYPAIGDGVFPIRAYEVACRRLGWRVDVPVFAWRDRYSLDEINQAYLQLPEVKRGRERGAQLVDEYKRKHERSSKQKLEEREDVERIVGAVFTEMPHATEDDKNYAIAKRAHISIDQAKRWKRAYRSNHPKQPLS